MVLESWPSAKHWEITTARGAHLEQAPESRYIMFMLLIHLAKMFGAILMANLFFFIFLFFAV